MMSATRKAEAMGKLQKVQSDTSASYPVSILWAYLWTFTGNAINNTDCLGGRVRCRDVLLKHSFPDVEIILSHIPRSNMRHVMRSNAPQVDHSPYREDENRDEILQADGARAIAVRCHQTPKLSLDFQGTLCLV